MRKLIISIFSLFMSLLLLCVATFAWANTPKTGVYRVTSFTASEPEVANYLYIGTSNTQRGSEFYTNTVSGMSLKPCTTSDYNTWYWEDSNTLTYSEKSANVISETVYLNSEAQYSKVTISSVEVTGAGSLAPAIRVAAVSTGGQCVASQTTSDGILNIATRNAYKPVDIYIWIEGTDPACTYENILTASNISVTITFEGSN